MKPYHFLLLALVGVICAGGLGASDLADDDGHYGEMSTHRETTIGDTRLTHSILFSPRFFSVSHILGRDDTFNRRALLGIDFLTLRYEAMIEHRLSADTSINLRPTTSFGWGFLAVDNHELFELETLGNEVERRSDLKVQNVVVDFGLRAGIKMGVWEPYFDYRMIWGFRFQSVKTHELLFRDPSNGVIDRVGDSDRKEEDQALMHAWGVGLAIHFGEEPWNYSFGMHLRPINPVTFKENTTTLWGGGFEFRANALRLTDDSALALITRWDFWIGDNEANDVHHFEFGVGVRFS